MSRLLAMMSAAEASPEDHVLPTELIVRGSTDAKRSVY